MTNSDTDPIDSAAYELGELRQQYHEEIAMMRILCHDAVVAAEQLGVNTDLLKREQQALAEQENKVFVITDHMGHKEELYRERGKPYAYPIIKNRQSSLT